MERLDLATWLRTRGQLDVPVALDVVDRLAAELDSAQASHAEIRSEHVLVDGLDDGGPVTAGLSGAPRPGPDSTPLALAALLREIVPAGAAGGADRVVTAARAGTYADASAMARAARAELASTGRRAVPDMRETRVVSLDDIRLAESPAAAASGRDHRETRVMNVAADAGAAPSETFVRPADDASGRPLHAETSVHRITDPPSGAGAPAHSETIVRPPGGSSAPSHSETMARPAGAAAQPAHSDTMARPADAAGQPSHSETMARPSGAAAVSPPSHSETTARPADAAGQPSHSETMARPSGAAAVPPPSHSETMARPAGTPPQPVHSETMAGPAGAQGAAEGPASPAGTAPDEAAVDPSVTRTPSWSSTGTRPTPPPVGRRRRRGRGAVWVVLLVVVAALVWWFWPFSSASPVQVTGATVTPGQASGCDVTVRVVGTIRTNGLGGDITYQWLRSDGTTSPPMTQTVENGRSSVDVPLLWTVSGPGRFTGTATLKVLEPNPTQAEGSFRYDCG